MCPSRFEVKGMLHNHISVKFSVIARNSHGFSYSVYNLHISSAGLSSGAGTDKSKRKIPAAK